MKGYQPTRVSLKAGVFATALRLGLETAISPPEFPLLVTAREERLAELQRGVSWKTLDALRRPFDKIWGDRLTELLAKAGREAGSEYRSTGSVVRVEGVLEDVLFSPLSVVYRRLYDQVAETFGKRAADAARALLRQEQRQDFFDETPDAREWVAAQTGSRIVNVSNATRAAVRKLVDAGVTDGLSTDEIAKALTDGSIFGKARAWRVARTEVVAASNAGNHFSTARFLPNSRFVKVWLSSRDIRVRDSHITADGQRQDLDAPFRLPGGLLRFPGDSTLGASAAEIVHCRCTTIHEPRGRRR